jgi:hypothetical protein
MSASGEISGISRLDQRLAERATISLYFNEQGARHNIPRVFSEFFNKEDYVTIGSLFSPITRWEPVLGNWVSTLGRPISEPYWVDFTINGTNTDLALVQAYERRILTYIPAYSAEHQAMANKVSTHAWITKEGS